MKNIALILTSGTGKRTGLDIPKQFYKVAGKYIIEHTIEVFENNKNIDEIIIVSHKDYVEKLQNIVYQNSYKKVSKVIKGGDVRQESSYNGINVISEAEAKVLIHDGVRPFLQTQIIDDCINFLDKYDAVSVAVDSPDTIVEVDENDCIKNIPQRKFLRRNQTPQAFKLSVIKKAHEYAKENGIQVTDDCGLVHHLNLCKIFIIQGNDFNYKITYPKDIAIAEKIYELKNQII